MNINGYILSNETKIERATNGTITKGGGRVGGVALIFDKDEKLTNGDAIIAEYDRLGGLIQKEGPVDKKTGAKKLYQVKTGSFYDFKAKVARTKPEVVFIFRDLLGNPVEVEEGEPVPMDVQAAEIVKDSKAAKKGKKSETADEDEE